MTLSGDGTVSQDPEERWLFSNCWKSADSSHSKTYGLSGTLEISALLQQHGRSWAGKPGVHNTAAESTRQTLPRNKVERESQSCTAVSKLHLFPVAPVHEDSHSCVSHVHVHTLK